METDFMKENSHICIQYILNIDVNQVTSEISAKLLGINITNELSLNQQVSSLYKKACNQLEAITKITEIFRVPGKRSPHQ